MQADSLNRARGLTTIVLPLTSNLRRAALPGNVLVQAEVGGLPVDSVVIVNQPVTVDKADLVDYVGEVPSAVVADVLRGVALVLGMELR